MCSTPGKVISVRKFIKMYILKSQYIYHGRKLLDSLIGVGVSVLTAYHEVAGSIPGTSTVLNVA